MTVREKTVAEEQASAKAALDRILSRYGWRYVGSKVVRPGTVIEYEIARIADDRRATIRRPLHEMVCNPIDEAAETALGDLLPVALSLALKLVARAKEINAEVSK